MTSRHSKTGLDELKARLVSLMDDYSVREAEIDECKASRADALRVFDKERQAATDAAWEAAQEMGSTESALINRIRISEAEILIAQAALRVENEQLSEIQHMIRKSARDHDVDMDQSSHDRLALDAKWGEELSRLQDGNTRRKMNEIRKLRRRVDEREGRQVLREAALDRQAEGLGRSNRSLAVEAAKEQYDKERKEKLERERAARQKLADEIAPPAAEQA